VLRNLKQDSAEIYFHPASAPLMMPKGPTRATWQPYSALRCTTQLPKTDYGPQVYSDDEYCLAAHAAFTRESGLRDRGLLVRLAVGTPGDRVIAYYPITCDNWKAREQWS